jgi:uncharacterized membrane protein
MESDKPPPYTPREDTVPLIVHTQVRIERYWCTVCRSNVNTYITYDYYTETIIMTIVLFIICPPLFWIPLVCSSMKVNYLCDRCGNKL